MARLSGTPPASRLASSRVNDSTALAGTRPTRAAPAAASAFFLAAAASLAWSILTGDSPWRAICAISAPRVSADIMPVLRLPSLARAV